ncbi:MFS transporter [Arthrobacter sp. MDT1-48-3]
MIPAPSTTQRGAPVLLSTQLVFNIGFYAVVPFLALVMSEDLGLGAAAIGVVLGVRTFSQQGLFLLGGVLADRWGPRRSILSGCVLRAAGYCGLAAADSFWPFLLGAVLTGMGGALFSPAVEGLVGALDRARAADGSRRRSLFAWLVLFGEVGAVTGPLVGTGLLPLGFPIVAGSAACLFLTVGVVLWLIMPRGLPTTAPSPRAAAGGHDTWACLRERRFLAFCAFFGINLLAYNQLYFTLPLELQQSGAGAGLLGMLFTIASILTIALQLPASSVAARMGTVAALRAGFSCIAVAFLLITLLGTTGMHLVPGLPAATGPVCLVVLLSLGRMLVGPAGLQQVQGFAGARPLGAYYGLLTSCGGLAVVCGNTLIGVLRDTVGSTSGWVLLVLLSGAAAVFLPRFLPLPSTAA